MPRRMHDAQIPISVPDVAALVADQFPQWSALSIRLVESDGTDNALFRLGEDLVARFALLGDDPVRKLAQVKAEIAAAGRIGAATSVSTPRFVALGQPGSTYPLPWSVYRWLPGTVSSRAGVAGSVAFAGDTARFIREVRAIDAQGQSFQGTRRGGRLITHDEYVATGLRDADGLIDTRGLARLWRRLRHTPRTEPDVWAHGDLMPGNLLAENGRLVGVIDVGQSGVADPALDLQPAWNFFVPPARTAFRQALDVDDDAWERGKGWAFVQAIGCLAYYRKTNPVMSSIARTTLLALLADEA